MIEPVTLAVLGTVALTEGIKFLYEQTGEVLKLRREQRDTAKTGTQSKQATPSEVDLPDVFDEKVLVPAIDFHAVERLEGDLRQTRAELADYAQDIEPVDVNNAVLLKRIDALRLMLEAIYQQRITFKGEQRILSGPNVGIDIDIEHVAGYVAAIRADSNSVGSYTAQIKVGRVEKGGKLVGYTEKRSD